MAHHIRWVCLLAAMACGGEGTNVSDGGDANATDVGASGDSIAPDAGTPTYPVYAGCETPPSTFTRTVYVDPSNAADAGDGSQGSPFQTLADAFAQKKILPGDHVVVMPGAHGAIAVSKYNSAQLVGATAWIWLDFQAGATAQSFDIRDMSSWLITHAAVSAPSTTLVSFNGSTNMVLADSTLATVADASSWTANEWINIASSGISVRNGQCVSLLRNKVQNTRFGIAISSDALARPDTSVKVLAQENEVAGFSGDAMRVVASDVLVKNNYLHDVYVSQADGDDNHDDALQMWALNGATFDNITIDGNWVQETTSATRPLQNTLQGIDDFDGVNTHVSITNNVVLVSAYHGISLYGAQDSLIDHNTVANPTTNGFKTWIMVNDTKAAAPSVNLTVTNNAATSFDLASTTTNLVNTNNVVVADPTATYTTFDIATMTFDLTPKTGSVLDGKGAGAPSFKAP